MQKNSRRKLRIWRKKRNNLFCAESIFVVQIYSYCARPPCAENLKSWNFWVFMEINEVRELLPCSPNYVYTGKGYQKALDILEEAIRAIVRTENVRPGQYLEDIFVLTNSAITGLSSLESSGIINFSRDNFEYGKAYLQEAIRTPSKNNSGNIVGYLFSFEADIDIGYLNDSEDCVVFIEPSDFIPEGGPESVRAALNITKKTGIKKDEVPNYDLLEHSDEKPERSAIDDLW